MFLLKYFEEAEILYRHLFYKNLSIRTTTLQLFIAMKINKQLRFLATLWNVKKGWRYILSFCMAMVSFTLALHTKSQIEQKIDGFYFGGFIRIKQQVELFQFWIGM